MLRIHFTGEDTRRITVAGADLSWETLFSLHLLQERDDSLVFGEWRRRVRGEQPAHVRLLYELAPPSGYSVDFLTPGRGDADFDMLVDRMLCTPRRQLRDDLQFLAGQRPASPWTRSLAAADVPALRRLGSVVSRYHEVALAPYRAHLRAAVQADQDRRARALLTGGVDALLRGLHPRVRWQPPVLQVLDYPDHDVRLDGRGLVLLPSLFCRRRPVTLRDADRPPVLVYPVSPGLGWLGPTAHPTTADPVADLLGRTRAAVLRATTAACATTELAGRVGLSPAAASRQAAVLREAGLVGSRRDGGSVLHQITALGIAVLDGRLPV
jgi:DNA-binding transcriptional ArsR family regulator